MQLDTDWNGLSPDSVVIESVTRTERTNSYNFEKYLNRGRHCGVQKPTNFPLLKVVLLINFIFSSTKKTTPK